MKITELISVKVLEQLCIVRVKYFKKKIDHWINDFKLLKEKERSEKILLLVEGDLHFLFWGRNGVIWRDLYLKEQN